MSKVRNRIELAPFRFFYFLSPYSRTSDFGNKNSFSWFKLHCGVKFYNKHKVVILTRTIHARCWKQLAVEHFENSTCLAIYMYCKDLHCNLTFYEFDFKRNISDIFRFEFFIVNFFFIEFVIWIGTWYLILGILR